MAFRRLAALWCLAALCAGEVAQAKVLIIRSYTNRSNLQENEIEAQNIRNTRLLESIIRRTGGVYTTVRSDKSRTEWARTGAQVWGAGTAGEFVEQFDGVIVPHAQSETFAGQVRGDSLTRMTVQGREGAAVPALVFRDNGPVLTGTADAPAYDGPVDSCGVTDVDTGPGKAIWQKGTTQAFLTHAYTSGITGSYNTGDLRKILFAGTPAYEYRSSTDDAGGTANIACAWCDSMATYADNDTLVLWERQYGTRITQASTIVFSSSYGAGAAVDSIQNIVGDAVVPRPATEGDFAVTLAALARLDSLVRADGGTVLGNKVIKVAVVVYGALARGERHGWKSPGSAQGILSSDTSAFYTVLDSVSALGIPITFAGNMDSAASYARDVIKLKSVRLAKFTPQVWNGVSDSAVAGGQNAINRPVDVFGRYRVRFAIGDDSGAGADSSIKTLAKSSLRMADSLFGRDRVSRIAVAPDDDWSPKNVTGGQSGGVTIDSVLYALKLAGYNGVVADSQDPDADASKRTGPAATNPRGYYNQQRTYTSGLIPELRDFKILTHSGFAVIGGNAQAYSLPSGTRDSTSYKGAVGWTSNIYRELSRFWSAALLDHDDSYDTWAYDDINSGPTRVYDGIVQRRVDRTQAAVHRPVVKGSIYRLSCSDLSGLPGGPPAASGFHILKAAKNAMDTINRLAGRTVVAFAYPDDIEP